MRGEYLEPEPEPEPENTLDLDTQTAGANASHSNKGTAAAADDDWQDMASYQAEQGIEIGEMGDRTNVVREGGEEPLVQNTDKKKRKKGDQADEEQPLANGELDKEARKKAKKERDMQRKRDKAAKGKSE
jgi:hypothetical protein